MTIVVLARLATALHTTPERLIAAGSRRSAGQLRIGRSTYRLPGCDGPLNAFLALTFASAGDPSVWGRLLACPGQARACPPSRSCKVHQPKLRSPRSIVAASENPGRARTALATKLEAIEGTSKERTEEQKAFGLDEGFGIYLTFQSEPNFELKFESLDVSKSGIELCNLKQTADNRTQATVYVPDANSTYSSRR
jgi:uncharacterized protein (DUF2147 family)